MSVYDRMKDLLHYARPYSVLQTVLGGHYARTWIANNVWRVVGEEKVVDIGCGPGDALEYLPRDITFLGFDPNPAYIAAARQQFGSRGLFLVGDVGTFANDSRFVNATLVMCNGVLHHLEDQAALQVLAFGKTILADGGRLICVEPCYLQHQGKGSRWLMRQDRGQHIRDEEEWKHLTRQIFEHYTTRVITGLLWVPYVHIIVECQR